MLALFQTAIFQIFVLYKSDSTFRGVLYESASTFLTVLYKSAYHPKVLYKNAITQIKKGKNFIRQLGSSAVQTSQEFHLRHCVPAVSRSIIVRHSDHRTSTPSDALCPIRNRSSPCHSISQGQRKKSLQVHHGASANSSQNNLCIRIATLWTELVRCLSRFTGAFLFLKSPSLYMHTQTHFAHPASEIIFKNFKNFIPSLSTHRNQRFDHPGFNKISIKFTPHYICTLKSVLTPPISPNFVNFL